MCLIGYYITGEEGEQGLKGEAGLQGPPGTVELIHVKFTFLNKNENEWWPLNSDAYLLIFLLEFFLKV